MATATKKEPRTAFEAVAAFRWCCDECHLPSHFTVPPLWPMTLELADSVFISEPYVDVHSQDDARRVLASNSTTSVRVSPESADLLRIILLSPSFRLRRVLIAPSRFQTDSSGLQLPDFAGSSIRSVAVSCPVDFASLATAPALRNVYVSRAPIYTIAGLEKVVTLRSITISAIPIGNDSIVSLARLPHLTTLTLSDCVFIMSLSCLQDCPSLTHLECRACPHVDLLGLERVQGLKYLSLECNAHVADVNHLGGLASLETLKLNFTSVTKDGIQGLLRCRRLIRLDLTATRVTDVESFAHIPHVASDAKVKPVVQVSPSSSSRRIKPRTAVFRLLLSSVLIGCIVACATTSMLADGPNGL